MPQSRHSPFKQARLCQIELGSKGRRMELHMLVRLENCVHSTLHYPRISLKQISKLHGHILPCTPFEVVRILLKPCQNSKFHHLCMIFTTASVALLKPPYIVRL